ncbi:transposable element [Tanacetum coccineum]|uniref:Transposable element n=1 Tax=Tanacetum coccineum TaxID=301880 RepID=A0ABQ5GDV0_9ASTR
MDTKLKRSTAFHPQTDGQTEVVNRTVVYPLRGYNAKHPNTWDESIPFLKFAINQTVHSSTNKTPLELKLFEPSMLDDEPGESLPFVDDLVTEKETVLTEDTIVERKTSSTRRGERQSFQIGKKDNTQVQQNDNRKRLMRADELHKFYDGTLNKVLSKLEVILRNNRLGYNNEGMENYEWTAEDKRGH